VRLARVTAYIPVYNGAEFVGPNIEGLLSQTHPFDEILVIDDGSTDATAEIASGYKGVTVIRHAKNKGVAGGRNTALAAARNELVAAFDADCVAHPAWLASLLPHLDDPNRGDSADSRRPMASRSHGSRVGSFVHPQSNVPLRL
jgi:glycosyltransferase involved in cell wall biosynthesis